MRVIDIENINYSMRDETQFVLHCEEVFHDKISSAAAKILNEKKTAAVCGSFRSVRQRKNHNSYETKTIS